MLETLYLSKCLLKGPNSPPEPINLEEWDHVSQRKAEDSKEGNGQRQRRVKKERGKEGWSKARRKWWKIKLAYVPECGLSSNSESSNLDFVEHTSNQHNLLKLLWKCPTITALKCSSASRKSKNGKDLKVMYIWPGVQSVFCNWSVPWHSLLKRGCLHLYFSRVGKKHFSCQIKWSLHSGRNNTDLLFKSKDLTCPLLLLGL